MNIKKTYLIFLLGLLPIYSKSNNPNKTLDSMSLEQKIAQLFVIAVDLSEYLPEDSPIKSNPRMFNSERADQFKKALAEELICQHEVGGVLFIGYGTIPICMQAIQELQNMSKIPLLISQDFEWGLNMRLVDAIKFPYNMTLGAIQDNKLIYQMASEIARQCKLLGVHMNFAPVVDVNSNPNNPIIGARSFGEDKENVADKAINFMLGLQDNGIIACAKHFCGHGDTDTDSHLDLPIIKHDLKRLQDIEIYPFKKLIDAGIKSIMSAHINAPAIDSRKNRPITLSKPAITGLLQQELEFTGIVVTDGLNMKAISKHFEPGEAELESFIAGNDILLMSEDIPKAILTIKQAVQDNKITEEEINRRALKILTLKEDLGLLDSRSDNQETISIQGFSTPQAQELKTKLYESAITVVRDKHKLLPLDKNASITFVQVGNSKQIDNQPETLETCDTIVVSLFGNRITQEALSFLQDIQKLDKNVVLIIFGSPYSLRHFYNIPTVIVAYEAEPEAQLAAKKVIFGELKATGKLPISEII